MPFLFLINRFYTPILFLGISTAVRPSLLSFFDVLSKCNPGSPVITSFLILLLSSLLQFTFCANPIGSVFPLAPFLIYRSLISNCDSYLSFSLALIAFA